MRGLVLLCSPTVPNLSDRPGLRTVSILERPNKSNVDSLLGESELLIVAGTDDDLAAVVVRLLRTERLGTTRVGFVPTNLHSAAARRWRLHTEPHQALDAILNAIPEGTVHSVPLIRDDAGGVLLGQAILESVQGEAYCDDQLILRGKAKSITVEPDDKTGLSVQVKSGKFFTRTTTSTGRAVQVGGPSIRPEINGVLSPRVVKRWTWYRHTEDLQLVKGER